MQIASLQALAGTKGRVRVDDQVKLLGGAGLKPRSREIERGPRDLLQPEDLAVKAPRAFEVGDGQADVMNGFDLHGISVAIMVSRKIIRKKMERFSSGLRLH